MKITTWNVNSIRSRLERALAWLDRREPDVVALQETKVVDEVFPREPFEERGYHVETFGQKTYNGVALLSKHPLQDVVRGFGDDPDEERRLIAATVEGVKVVDVYVPNGKEVESPKFPFKLGWLDRLSAFLADYASSDEPLLLLGDFNIAPEDRDVHDPDAWRGKVLFHPKEHEALAKIQDTLGLTDLFRQHEDGDGLFTWWDYRQLGFPRNAGLRIDLLLGTASLAGRCEAVLIERDERKGKKPSDHAPVTGYFDESPS